MPKTDPFETDLLNAYKSGQLRSVVSKSELAHIRAAARATARRDKRVNIRLVREKA